MKLSFSHRAYPGNSPRPLPEVELFENLNLVVIAVPWGNRAAARKVVDRVSEYMTFAYQDKEATSPLQKLSCLSPLANHLRIATQLANEMLYREDNREEYKVGVELLLVALSDYELCWSQVGGPHLLLSRDQKSLLPVGSNIDLSLDISDISEQSLSALPGQMLGLDPTVNPTINSLRARPNDRLVMISHSRVPTSFFQEKLEIIDLNAMTTRLAVEQPHSAFWLGSLGVQNSETSVSFETESRVRVQGAE